MNGEQKLEEYRKKINKDLEKKPAGVKEEDWNAFKQKRMNERREIERDEGRM